MAHRADNPTYLKYNPETDRTERVVVVYYEESAEGVLLVSSPGPGRFYYHRVCYPSWEDWVREGAGVPG